MDIPLFVSFVGFAFLASLTPGPNNFMLMSSGALFGFRRTLPHIFGVFIGFNILMLASILGLGILVERFPWLLSVVKVTGALWLAWLGFQYARAAFHHSASIKKATKNRSRPLRFYEAALYQWANPKAVIIAIAVAGAYVGISNNLALRASLICGAFIIAGAVAASTWTVAGSTLNRIMSNGRPALALNVILATLLFATALMILLVDTHHG
ncbi:MAG TPA: LysE family translocator [Hellea balneolensis]|uniref:LysE family translocator n=1 Tax=Hellea balneolensis TaxID=287478 RepID=A0A7C5R358_9PROT|nr:LysE family translocator [Hellea balneolensis]